VNRWNKFFFDALQNKDQRLILLSIGLMLALAFASALTSVALLQRACASSCAARMANADARAALDGAPSLLSAQRLRLIDNPEARISEDGGSPSSSSSTLLRRHERFAHAVSFVSVLCSSALADLRGITIPAIS